MPDAIAFFLQEFRQDIAFFVVEKKCDVCVVAAVKVCTVFAPFYSLTVSAQTTSVQ